MDGAATAEEAKDILRKSLNAHLKQWKIEAWQAEHPDHEEIPAQWQEFRNWRPRSRAQEMLWKILGIDLRALDNERWAVFKPFKSASRFYARTGHLPMNEKVKSGMSKTQVWEEAKRLLTIRAWVGPIMREAEGMIPYIPWNATDEAKEEMMASAIDFLAKAKAARDAATKKRRCPGRGKKRKPSRARKATRKPSRARKGK